MTTYRTTTTATTKHKRVLDSAVKNILKPRPKYTGSEWANSHFILSAETATEPGSYRWERAPYQKEWLDVLTDESTQKIVLMTSSRVGKTSVMKAATLFWMVCEPTPIMWMLPNLEIAKQFSTSELDPALRDVRIARDLIKDKRQRDSGNNILQKRYTGGVLHLIGAESPSGLHGKTVRVLFADEADRFPFSAGKDGDPLTLAEVRTTTFQHRRKVVVSSTPTIKDLSHIETAYNASDRRRYHVPCPHCGFGQVLVWKQLMFKDTPNEPEYVCVECAACISETQKFAMLQQGRWIAENPESKTKGYHLNALYSVHMSWADLVAEWQAAKNDRFKLQVFINTRLGETWDESGERVSEHELAERLEKYNAQIPTKDETCNGVGILGASMDVQENRLEVAVWGFGGNDELWLVDSLIFDGDTGTDGPWQKAANYFLTARYQTLHGVAVGIRAIAVDSGYQTERAYRFVQHLQKLDTSNRSIIATKGVEAYPRFISDRPKNSKKYNALLWSVGTTIAKDHVAALLKNNPPGASTIHLPTQFPSDDGQPRWLDMEILKQLTSERPVIEYKGGKTKRVWKKFRANEQFDLLIYAYAAVKALGPNVLNDLPNLAQKLADLRESEGGSPTHATPASVPVNPSGIRIHQPKTQMKNRSIWGR
jgi:phage terminase large subunit GpA-like protein